MGQDEQSATTPLLEQEEHHGGPSRHTQTSGQTVLSAAT